MLLRKIEVRIVGHKHNTLNNFHHHVLQSDEVAALIPRKILTFLDYTYSSLKINRVMFT